MSATRRNTRPSDPLSMMFDGMRRISGLDFGEVTLGLSSLGDPDGVTRPDPVSRLAAGIRQIGSMDLGDITRGVESFLNPSARGMLDAMGRTQEERVEKLATMLRNGTQADLEEMGTVYMLAMARAAEEQADDDGQHLPRRRAERPWRRRGQTSAEWREERRRAS